MTQFQDNKEIFVNKFNKFFKLYKLRSFLIHSLLEKSKLDYFVRNQHNIGFGTNCAEILNNWAHFLCNWQSNGGGVKFILM